MFSLVERLRSENEGLRKSATGLAAVIERLREAREKARYVPGDHPIVPVKIDVFLREFDTIFASTPSCALAEHDRNLIERCAEVARQETETYNEGVSAVDVRFSITRAPKWKDGRAIANAILALAERKPERANG